MVCQTRYKFYTIGLGGFVQNQDACLRSFVKFITIAIARDIRNTFRNWRLNPGTTLASYVALTVGIGATTTIFSVLSSLLLSPLPIPESERVVRVTGLDNDARVVALNMPDALDIKRRVQTAGAFAFFRLRVGNLAGESRPMMVHVLETDADLFNVMKVRMAQGRPFEPSANEPGHACSVAISWPFWQSQFGGLAVAGQIIRLNGEPCAIYGVLPKQLDLPELAEVWMAVPFNLKVATNGRRIRSWYGMARLNRDESVGAFNAELAAVCNELSHEFPSEDSGLRMQATLLRDWLTEGVRKSLLVLFAAVSGVLLLACANVANLLLARSSARLREISVRVAIGANRVMLFQQLITESLMLALAASLSGLIFTAAAVRLIRDLPNVPIPRPESIGIDWRVLIFALSTAGLTGMLFGSLPALRVSMTSLSGVLSQAGGRVSETRLHQLVRKLLVGAETLMATVLLIASLLLLRSFSEVSRVNAGFQPDHLLTAYVSLSLDRYKKDTMDTVRFANKVIDSLKNRAGIEGATMATSVPLRDTEVRGPVQIEGAPIPLHESDSPFILKTGVNPNFRKTLHIPLLAGRDLEKGDEHDNASSILVNAAFAKRFFPGENAVGKRLRYSPATNPDAPWLQVVGVLGDIRQDGLESAVLPQLFMPLAAAVSPFPAIIIRTSDNPILHLREIQDAVHQADPDVPVFQPRTMEQVEAHSLGLRLFSTTLLSCFAGIALLLAFGGIFAVIAYSVSQRTQEIGVRMACGASQGDIVRMIMRQGLLPAFTGISVGVLAALVVNRYLESLLFGVRTTDITSYLVTVCLLVAFSTLAALAPARRAARVQPWRALRYE